MDAPALRVVADDLTGACDIAVACLPWDGDVLVEAYPSDVAPPAGALWVRNTQSRTLGAAVARSAVRRALATPAPRDDAVLLKKIDTALRGHLGAELDAAIEAMGAQEAFVLPAIPHVGRTTVGGIQLHDGVPVHETAFAHDPLHAIRESRVVAHLERESERRGRALGLDEVRSPAVLVAAIARGRRDGCSVFVCDAESDDDLDRALDVLLERPRPVVLAGSLGLGSALRRRLVPRSVPRWPTACRQTRRGTLVVVGSTHPTARLQAEAVAGREAVYEISDGNDTEHTASRVAAVLEAGAVAVLRTPGDVAPGTSAGLLDLMARTVAACVSGCRPGGLVLVGGETAHAVLEGLGQSCIRVVAAVGPLIVGGELIGGALDGTPIVTKGGSSGEATSLRHAVAWLAGEGR